MHKLKKGEAVLTAAVIIICAAVAALFVFKSDKKINAELAEKKISGVSFSDAREFEPTDALVTAQNDSGKEYAKSFMLAADTYMRLDDDGKVRIYDQDNVAIEESDFTDDIGNVLTVKCKDGAVEFYTDTNGEVGTFLVNGHTVELISGKLYVDLVSMAIPSEEAVDDEQAAENPEAEGEASGESADESSEQENEDSKEGSADSEGKEQPEDAVLIGEADVVSLADEATDSESSEQENNEQSDSADQSEQAAVEDRPTESEYVPADSYTTELIRLINNERTKRGLSELTATKVLGQVSLVRAKEITENFSHKRGEDDADSVLLSYGASYSFYGENIAAGEETAEAVVSDWMNSDSTRSNILNPDATSIGCAHRYSDGDESYLFDYWTMCVYAQ